LVRCGWGEASSRGVGEREREREREKVGE
jgi:hypothetical protein